MWAGVVSAEHRPTTRFSTRASDSLPQGMPSCQGFSTGGAGAGDHVVPLSELDGGDPLERARLDGCRTRWRAWSGRTACGLTGCSRLLVSLLR